MYRFFVSLDSDLDKTTSNTDHNIMAAVSMVCLFQNTELGSDQIINIVTYNTDAHSLYFREFLYFSSHNLELKLLLSVS